MKKMLRSVFGNRIAAETWRLYEKTLHEEKALDFDLISSSGAVA